MNKFLTKAVLGMTLGATALTVAAPADAQRYRRYHRGGDATGAAIVGGIAGLAIGAAIASGDRDRYYRDDYYYRDYPRYNYYYNDYPRYRECRIERRYDPYYGRPMRVRVCY